MKNFFSKIKTYFFSHKITSIIIVLAVVFVGYQIYKKYTNTNGETRYVMASVAKGTIISLVSGSGQVSALNQIAIQPKAGVSGAITRVNVNPGDTVRAGQALFTIDTTDAEKAVRDAEINLQNANLALQKLQIQNSNENTDANLTKAYSDGFNAVSATFSDLSSTINGLQSILAGSNLSDNVARNDGANAIDYRNIAESAYYRVEVAYEKNKTDWSALDYNSKQADIDALISETYDTTQLLSSAIKDLNDYVNLLAGDTGKASNYTSYQATLSGYTSTTSSHISALLSAQTNIKSYKDALPNDNIDLQTASINVTQKQNALLDAQNTLADYYIKAPFDGVIASIPVQVGNSASSSTTLGTLITQAQVAIISLNEVDVAKIALGQKVTLAFDAIPDLSITGKVAQIDSVGTVSSGVVNYNVKISFDTSDGRVKPGMSVNADIITNIKQDVLLVPNSAVKTQNGTSYVQMFDVALPAPAVGVQGSPSLVPPINQTVEIGIANDTNTEIISGLKEGDQVVMKTITGTTTASASAPSIFGAVGGNRGGGGGNAAGALGR